MADESKVTLVREEEEEQVQLPVGEGADVGGRSAGPAAPSFARRATTV